MFFVGFLDCVANVFTSGISGAEVGVLTWFGSFAVYKFLKRS